MTAFDPLHVLGQLTFEEKVSLLSGGDQWHTAAVPRLDIPRARVSDGPNGVRGISMLNSAPSACFPCATGTGASFDIALLRKIGESLGEECRARGVHCLLGPTTNIQRDPRGGRGFESFGEDPYHAGTMAKAWIEGVQSRYVMTCPKHLVCNEQELNRRSTNSVLDERTLHEIYLEPFRIQCQAKPKTIMSSYNKLNGLHASEDPHLLRDILRGDFLFDGMVMSDWGGTYSGGEAIAAGMDLEMPGPSMMRGSPLEREIVSGKLDPADLDACVLNVLRFVHAAVESGIPSEMEEGTVDTPQVRRLLRQSAADSVVLLKNDSGILPLHPQGIRTIAVIGPNADIACIAGGGSANLTPTYRVTPLEAIRSVASGVGATVQHTTGVEETRWTPLLGDKVRDTTGALGRMTADFFAENPFDGRLLEPAYSMSVANTHAFFIDGIPTSVPIRGYIRARMSFTPNATGVWILGLTVAGQGDLYVDDKMVVENSTNQEPDVSFFNTGAKERIGEIQLQAGQSYTLEVRFSNFKQISAMSPYAGRRGGMRIGARFKYDPEAEIERAVQMARRADVAILCVGLNGEWESESYDREDIMLPRLVNRLVEAVLDVRPDSIVINQSGMPVEMPWIAKAATVVQAFYGGNDCGNGIADVLFGKVNPSAKLPLTWPKSIEDYPAHKNFGHPLNTVYSEGINVGYRYFDRQGGPASLFPYGHGLSYTTFTYSALTAEWVDDISLHVSFDIENTGSVVGKEAALVFIHESRPRATRPEVELAGFAKTSHLQPGQKERLTIVLEHKAFSYFCTNRHCWIARKGGYEIRVGPSSVSFALATMVHLTESWQWRGLLQPRRFS
ncbi:glycoside hydrolase superfamily [Papiliotrema laurentii]|uniref:beta-glucosidase n=1 Tax=Papiliotrema laurentii TaxID=5418 RepID=A0AAD9L883_PAPLA|nr:glycoside hydrolase superfamily [Papiliotrema laurentii]